MSASQFNPSPVDLRPDDTRPPLEPVPAEHWTQRATRFTFALSVFVVIAALFGLAWFHASIVTQQRQLDTANQRLVEIQEQQDQLRVQLTEAEAPERILRVAQGQLGMVSVEPAHVTYLVSPAGELSPDAARALANSLPQVSVSDPLSVAE